MNANAKVHKFVEQTRKALKEAREDCTGDDPSWYTATIFEEVIGNCYSLKQSCFDVGRTHLKWNASATKLSDLQFLPTKITDVTLTSVDRTIVIDAKYYRTERPSLKKECGWKGGDRGGLARWEQYGKRRNKEEGRKREKQLIGLTLTGLLMEGLRRLTSGFPTTRKSACYK